MWIHFALGGQKKGIEGTTTIDHTSLWATVFVLWQDYGSSEPFEEEKYSHTYYDAGGNHSWHIAEVTFKNHHRPNHSAPQDKDEWSHCVDQRPMRHEPPTYLRCNWSFDDHYHNTGNSEEAEQNVYVALHRGITTDPRSSVLSVQSVSIGVGWGQV